MASLNSLVTIDEMSKRLKGALSVERLQELCDSQLIPHHIFEGRILFKISETKDWIDDHLIAPVPARPFPINVSLTPIVVDETPKDIPYELKGIMPYLLPLQIRSLEHAEFSGVYFLCNGNKIVYVGQSKRVCNRVGAHMGNKVFDYAFCLRVPETDLNYVESELIKALKPKYNISGKTGKLVTPGGGHHIRSSTEYGKEIVTGFLNALDNNLID